MQHNNINARDLVIFLSNSDYGLDIIPTLKELFKNMINPNIIGIYINIKDKKVTLLSLLDFTNSKDINLKTKKEDVEHIQIYSFNIDQVINKNILDEIKNKENDFNNIISHHINSPLSFFNQSFLIESVIFNQDFPFLRLFQFEAELSELKLKIETDIKENILSGFIHCQEIANNFKQQMFDRFTDAVKKKLKSEYSLFDGNINNWKSIGYHTTQEIILKCDIKNKFEFDIENNLEYEIIKLKYEIDKDYNDVIIKQKIESVCHHVFKSELSSIEKKIILFSEIENLRESIESCYTDKDLGCNILNNIYLEYYFSNIASCVERDAIKDYIESEYPAKSESDDLIEIEPPGEFFLFGEPDFPDINYDYTLIDTDAIYENDDFLESHENNFDKYFDIETCKLKNDSIIKFMPFNKRLTLGLYYQLLEFIKNFIIFKLNNDSIILIFNKIGWEGTHTPIFKPTPICVINKIFSEEELANTINNILKNTNYFKKCTKCYSLNNVGHMDANTCYSCMERMGYVF